MTRRTIALVVILAAVIAALILFRGTPASETVHGGNTPNTAWLQEFAVGEMAKLAPSDPAQPMPATAFADENGKALTFQDFKGQVLLVNFWATWCAPCRHEMPALDRLAEARGGDNFKVVTISIDRGGAPIAGAFLKEIGTTALPLYVDPKSAVSRALGVFGLPLTILVDANGSEIARFIGPAEWDSPEAKALIDAAVARSKGAA